ncbi:MAG: hypothetical protein IJW37_06080 [Lachnospiraceae bacterium]|nr:hypothetical protein [Lachnospiraceae bacterium]
MFSLQEKRNPFFWNDYSYSEACVSEQDAERLMTIQNDILTSCNRCRINPSVKYLYEEIGSRHALSLFLSELGSRGYRVNIKSLLTKDTLETVERFSVYLLYNNQ